MAQSWVGKRQLFRRRQVVDLIHAELEEAERGLLEAHSAREYAAAMVVYQQARVQRLKSQLADREKATPP